jgi:hypothetical protein
MSIPNQASSLPSKMGSTIPIAKDNDIKYDKGLAALYRTLEIESRERSLTCGVARSLQVPKPGETDEVRWRMIAAEAKTTTLEAVIRDLREELAEANAAKESMEGRHDDLVMANAKLRKALSVANRATQEAEFRRSDLYAETLELREALENAENKEAQLRAENMDVNLALEEANRENSELAVDMGFLQRLLEETHDNTSATLQTKLIESWKKEAELQAQIEGYKEQNAELAERAARDKQRAERGSEQVAELMLRCTCHHTDKETAAACAHFRKFRRLTDPMAAGDPRFVHGPSPLVLHAKPRRTEQLEKRLRWQLFGRHLGSYQSEESEAEESEAEESE